MCVCVCVSTVTWECTEIRPFGDAPLPRRRVGCAKVGNNPHDLWRNKVV